LRNSEEIYRAWLPLHRALKEEYFLNPEEHEDDAVESSRSEVLIANPHGIFGVSAHRSVLEFNRFYAYGSGYEFALGAMYARYDDVDYTAEQIAKLGVAAGAEFDDGSDTPIICQVIQLRDR
jgi:ATP-dependent HslUV protease, peptidase subunit HslV